MMCFVRIAKKNKANLNNNYADACHAVNGGIDMCGNEQFLQNLWVNDGVEMSFDDLLFAVRLNGFRYIGATSQRLILEKVQ